MQRTVVTRAPCWHSQRDAREDARPSGLGSGLLRAECGVGGGPPACPASPGLLRARGSALPPSTGFNVLGREQAVIQRGLFLRLKAASDTVRCFSDLFWEIEGFAAL